MAADAKKANLDLAVEYGYDPNAVVGLDSLEAAGETPEQYLERVAADAKKANLDLAVTHGYDPNAVVGLDDLGSCGRNA